MLKRLLAGVSYSCLSHAADTAFHLPKEPFASFEEPLLGDVDTRREVNLYLHP